MAIATAATAGVSTVMGAAKFFQGRKMQKEGERFVENFEWQDLQNPYESLSVSTLGSDLMQEQTNIGSASSVEALRNAGTRGVLGGLGRVEANRNLVNAQTASNLDTQQKEIDRLAASQDVANQNLMEKRQTDELAGYGQMINVGMGMKNQGMADIVNGLGAAGQAMAGLPSPNSAQQNPLQQSVSSFTPAGSTYSNLPSANLPWLR